MLCLIELITLPLRTLEERNYKDIDWVQLAEGTYEVGASDHGKEASIFTNCAFS
jgi:hypothetical protein